MKNMKKSDLEELVAQLKQDNERLQNEIYDYQGNLQKLELGEAVAKIIEYTLHETNIHLDIYNNITDALRDFREEKNLRHTSSDDEY